MDVINNQVLATSEVGVSAACAIGMIAVCVAFGGSGIFISIPLSAL